LGEPCEYQLLVTLLRYDLWELRTPPQRLEASGHVMRMIRHPKKSTDHDLNSIERPSFGLESRLECPSLEEFQKMVPLLVTQARRASGSRMMSQALQPLGAVPKLFGPSTDGSATDTQEPGDFGLGEPGFDQKPTAFHAAFFELSRGQNAGLPHAHPT
jgi:hypothetical protein